MRVCNWHSKHWRSLIYSSNREVDAVYNLPELSRATSSRSCLLIFLPTRALSCSHYEQQLSCTQLPLPIYTQRRSHCKLLLPVLCVAPGRSNFLWLCIT